MKTQITIGEVKKMNSIQKLKNNAFKIIKIMMM